jgi:hypothetical protein
VTRVLTPTQRDLNIQLSERITNVTSILIIVVAAMAWPSGYGLGVLLRSQAVGR